jgi:hypothetical protein
MVVPYFAARDATILMVNGRIPTLKGMCCPTVSTINVVYFFVSYKSNNFFSALGAKPWLVSLPTTT